MISVAASASVAAASDSAAASTSATEILGLTHAALMSRNVILASPVIEVKNATVPVGERFYDVPTSEFTVLNVIAPLTLS